MLPLVILFPIFVIVICVVGITIFSILIFSGWEKTLHHHDEDHSHSDSSHTHH
ncbi:MAG: hypothetical protein LH473_05195 [Chitinophagales bacterium]|nr:hypothetical protein [Chitinophagales bacterium]